jgi:hypothetical protein
MSIADREEQILRARQQDFYPQLKTRHHSLLIILLLLS